jgi:hypothetical protein
VEYDFAVPIGKVTMLEYSPSTIRSIVSNCNSLPGCVTCGESNREIDKRINVMSDGVLTGNRDLSGAPPSPVSRAFENCKEASIDSSTGLDRD